MCREAMSGPSTSRLSLIGTRPDDPPCLIHGVDHRAWRQVDRRVDSVAQHLIDAGLERQQAIAPSRSA